MERREEELQERVSDLPVEQDWERNENEEQVAVQQEGEKLCFEYVQWEKEKHNEASYEKFYQNGYQEEGKQERGRNHFCQDREENEQMENV